MWQPARPNFERLASAIYDVDLGEDAWMRGMLAATLADCPGVSDAFVGLGHVANGRATPVHSVATDEDLALEARRQSTDLSPEYVARRMHSFASTDRQLMGDAFERTTHGMAWRQRRGVEDVFVLSAFMATGRFVAFGAHVPATTDAWPGELVSEWNSVAMHISGGARLQQARASGAADVDAVFATDGRCMHAETAAESARTTLRDAVRRIERSRSRSRDKPSALEARHPHVDARWVLCDQFDADGKHFIVAYAERSEPRRPAAALSERETRVVELMISGWALKQIAYQLGLSEGAVSSYAHRACKKLGVRSRMALGQAFAQRSQRGGADLSTDVTGTGRAFRARETRKTRDRA